MRVYYHDNESGDCRLSHDSGEDLSLSDLKSLGVLYFDFPTSSRSSKQNLDELAKDRKYANSDEITVSSEALGADYEKKIKMFYDEHIHEDEEIRYILEGTGYFDVRDAQDKWIRIEAGPGDLLILPAGIYHRFTVDENNYIKAKRLYQNQPKWDCIHRGEEAEANQYRKDYILARNRGFK